MGENRQCLPWKVTEDLGDWDIIRILHCLQKKVHYKQYDDLCYYCWAKKTHFLNKSYVNQMQVHKLAYQVQNLIDYFNLTSIKNWQ